MMPITLTLPTAYAAGPFPLPLGEGKQAVNYLYVRDCNLDLPRLSGEAFAQRDAVRSNCAGLM
ncbi:hypothetical protein J2X47_003983 [Sphingomonas sp. BE270]|nr:hypothetical protein [Sphingomonas sp. BE270]